MRVCWASLSMDKPQSLTSKIDVIVAIVSLLSGPWPLQGALPTGVGAKALPQHSRLLQLLCGAFWGKYDVLNLAEHPDQSANAADLLLHQAMSFPPALCSPRLLGLSSSQL